METMSPDEVAYLERVFADREIVEAVFESYRTHLSRKYNLTAVDSFTREGVILRAVPLEEPTAAAIAPGERPVTDPTDVPLMERAP